MFLNTKKSEVFLYPPELLLLWLKKPELWVPLIELLTVLLEMVVEPWDVLLHSSSMSLSLTIIFVSWRYLSSSVRDPSGMVNILFLFTKLLVPGLPENSQLMPFQFCLKFDWMCFKRSRADISLGFFTYGWPPDGVEPDGGGTIAGIVPYFCCGWLFVY